MDVGVNYPWFDYGWDFGVAPPNWRGGGTNPQPRWYSVIDADLQRLRNLGIKVVRWFLLADGLTYGSGSDAPSQNSPGRWRFNPPTISSDFRTHFTELLGRFRVANAAQERQIQLMPVFLDFHFCEPGSYAVGITDATAGTTTPDPDWVKQGRADAINDASKRQRLLQRALEPLLQIAQTQSNAIYAWDIINEPEWVTNGWHPDGQMNHPVNEADMRAFIEDAKTLIRHYRFKPTIGFAKIQTIAQSRITAEINQFHHYPAGRERLPRHSFNPSYPGIIGEFATNTSDIWPDIAPDQSVLHRLQFASAQGYPLALPWSYRQRDRHTSWSTSEERQIECFVFGRNCSTPSGP
jgi:hypothetical protein